VLQDRRVLLIISGGIAAYKSLELIRRLRERGAAVRCIMTAAAQHFVTPLSVASLSEDKVYTDLWSLTDESEMGHIRLSREADLVVVAPASADLIARMATGLADDLATTALLASDKPVLIAPAMNLMMWAHPATQANLATIETRGVTRIGPGSGELACGEVGSGRMAEPLEIVAAIERLLTGDTRLAEKRVLVTSGPTREPIDPVRYISNHSSGRQKIKKNGAGPPVLRLAENPDILATIAQRGNDRPRLVIGFAAETEDVVENARAKRLRKRCDWILANDVSPGTGTFGGDRNTIHLVDADGIEDWPVMTKREVAARLAERIALHVRAPRGA